MMKTPKTKIPKFKSGREEARFWETHDVTDFLNELNPVKNKITFPKPQRRLVSMRLPESEIMGLKQVASRKGIGYLTLIRMWVTEKLLVEIEHRKNPA